MFGFGGKKKAATKKSIAALDGTLGAALVQMPRPPADFWKEPYVLGTIFGMAGTIATLDQLGTQEKGEVIHEALQKISGQPGMELPRLLALLMQTNQPDFTIAAERAAKLTVMIDKRQVIGSDSDIMVARARALADMSTDAPANEAQAVIEHLMVMWVVEPIRVLGRAHSE